MNCPKCKSKFLEIEEVTEPFYDRWRIRVKCHKCKSKWYIDVLNVSYGLSEEK